MCLVTNDPLWCVVEAVGLPFGKFRCVVSKLVSLMLNLSLANIVVGRRVVSPCSNGLRFLLVMSQLLVNRPPG